MSTKFHEKLGVSTDGYCLSHIEEDIDGLVKITLDFDHGVNYNSLVFALANEGFGEGKWEISSDIVERFVDVGAGHRSIGPWSHTVEIVRKNG